MHDLSFFVLFHAAQTSVNSLIELILTTSDKQGQANAADVIQNIARTNQNLWKEIITVDGVLNALVQLLGGELLSSFPEHSHLCPFALPHH